MIKSLALFLSKYKASLTFFLLSNLINKGFPVGISNFEIFSLSILNKYLHKALIEFP